MVDTLMLEEDKKIKICFTMECCPTLSGEWSIRSMLTFKNLNHTFGLRDCEQWVLDLDYDLYFAWGNKISLLGVKNAPTLQESLCSMC